MLNRHHVKFLLLSALLNVSCLTESTTKRNLNNPFGDYQFLFNPENYMDQLPSLSMPYINNIQIPKPNIPAQIIPSPVVTTKMISIVTRYINKNPVCIKLSGRKPPCPYKNSKNNAAHEYLVTKEYYVQDKLGQFNNATTTPAGIKKKRKKNKRRRKPSLTSYSSKNNNKNFNEANKSREAAFDVEPSESGRALTKILPTPVLNLANTRVKEILIEDRLDHLEEILPHYTRKRNYSTSTITVTKVRYNANKATATLLVKNCVPPDIAICPKKRRRTKDMRLSDDYT